MARPVLLDLFCKAGGAAEGYHLAGFDVVGVDLVHQPNYPYDFIQQDALKFLTEAEPFWHAIHASPPCQAFSSMRDMPDAREHPRLIDPIRKLLTENEIPYIIENVVGAPLI